MLRQCDDQRAIALRDAHIGLNRLVYAAAAVACLL